MAILIFLILKKSLKSKKRASISLQIVKYFNRSAKVNEILKIKNKSEKC